MVCGEQEEEIECNGIEGGQEGETECSGRGAGRVKLSRNYEDEVITRKEAVKRG